MTTVFGYECAAGELPSSVLVDELPLDLLHGIVDAARGFSECAAAGRLVSQAWLPGEHASHMAEVYANPDTNMARFAVQPRRNTNPPPSGFVVDGEQLDLTPLAQAVLEVRTFLEGSLLLEKGFKGRVQKIGVVSLGPNGRFPGHRDPAARHEVVTSTSLVGTRLFRVDDRNGHQADISQHPGVTVTLTPDGLRRFKRNGTTVHHSVEGDPAAPTLSLISLIATRKI